MRILSLVSCLAAACAGLPAATITGFVIHGASGTGSATGPVWNTWGGPEATPVPNLYIDTGGPIVNPGNGPSNAVSIVLNAGFATIGYCLQPGAVTSFWTLDIFFDGSSTPGISALVPTGVSAPTPNSNLTYRLDGQAQVSGAGTLTTVIGNQRITLLSFTMTGLPSKSDVVQNFDSIPGSGPDTAGPFVLGVQTIPEPMPAVLVSLGLLAVWVRRNF